jgi:pyridoxine 4-dehydrogenase
LTAATFWIGGDLNVRRIGYGAMALAGSGGWGEPPDPAAAKAVLRRALDLGVQLFDTADSYGPEVSEQLLADALHPYPSDVVVATKGGGAIESTSATGPSTGS